MVTVKNRTKKILSMALSILMLFVFAFMTGCSWFPTDNGTSRLKGIKVLRKPSSYDFNANSVTADYYSDFAGKVLNTLFQVYGISNYGWEDKKYASVYDALAEYSTSENISTLKEMYVDGSEDMKYFYDAIRYQVVSVSELNDNGTEDGSDDYYTVKINTNKGWKWGFDRDILPKDIYNSLLGKSDTYDISSGLFTLNVFESYYGLEERALTYYTTYLPNAPEEEEQDTRYRQMGLEYAIYSLVLGIEPEELDVVSGTVKNSTTSIEEARDAVKSKFNKLGTYVGLTATNVRVIKEYIKKYVIGSQTADGKQEMYYSDVVDAVVNYCVTLTPIANEIDSDYGGLTVGDSFMASEIVDYPTDSFFISTREGKNEFKAGSYEYQSMLFIPNGEKAYFNDGSEKPFMVSDVWLDFYYEARDENGNVITDDDSKTLDIDVHFNYWTGEELLTGMESIHIINGKYSAGGINTTLQVNFDEKEGSQWGKGLYEKRAKLDGFGDKLDEIDVANSPNKSTSGDGTEVLTLKGTTSARSFYTLKESNYSGAYGIFNYKKAGETPYLEIAFDVHKESGEVKNYDFYVAVVLFETYLADYSHLPGWDTRDPDILGY